MHGSTLSAHPRRAARGLRLIARHPRSSVVPARKESDALTSGDLSLPKGRSELLHAKAAAKRQDERDEEERVAGDRARAAALHLVRARLRVRRSDAPPWSLPTSSPADSSSPSARRRSRRGLGRSMQTRDDSLLATPLQRVNVLSGLVEAHWRDFVQHAREAYEAPLPKYVVDEFQKFLARGDSSACRSRTTSACAAKN